MIKHIIESISRTLDAEFGFDIYTEEIKQGLVEPCFFIMCVNPTTNLFLGKRYFRQNKFCIQYFPQTDNVQGECNEVGERLTWILQFLNVANAGEKDDLMRGSNTNYEVIDGVLNFFINYDCFVYVKEDSTPMETINIDITVKDGD